MNIRYNNLDKVSLRSILFPTYRLCRLREDQVPGEMDKELAEKTCIEKFRLG